MAMHKGCLIAALLILVQLIVGLIVDWNPNTCL